MSVRRPIAMLLAGAALVTLGACRASSGRLPPEPGPRDAQVGYGTRTEGALTGAVSSLSGTELNAARPMRVEELLQGHVAGLQFIRLANGGTTIRIRGTGSISGDREPLLVIDGIPVRESLAAALSGLLPEDIRRVDVLKDLASTAIYGMRGAGGVIIITTRR